ncbi:MAG: Asp-tRNA(Asn)/Glu-tRNA(Gln) amidotransferase subunit GatB [Phycisphaerales bacterium]
MSENAPTVAAPAASVPPAERGPIVRTRLMVGMEIHVELSTRTKMFTRTPNPAHPDFHDAPPNTLIDPVVAALPGALPVMNRAAVEMSMMVGLALGCTIPPSCKWDRKNYFYPDLPKGYQISQFDMPLCIDGAVDVEVEPGRTKRIGIIRAHLEEDTGKLSHELPGGGTYAGSLVDLNRAGTPLLEIVTQPDFDSAEETVAFARELRAICRALGVTPGIMQRGHMRFEPNINVVIETKDGHEYRTPIVEIKNLNSFRAVKGAIEHEYERQIAAFTADGLVMGPGAKSTRGWDDAKLVTVLQRQKEDAHDYRYFPEPDLVRVDVSPEWVESVRAQLPELPRARRARYAAAYELPELDAAALVEEHETADWFDACVEALRELAGGRLTEASAGKACAKIILNAATKRAREAGVATHEVGISPRQVAELVDLRERDVIGSSAGSELFNLLCETDDAAEAVANANGLVQVRDAAAMDEWIAAAIEQQPQAAEDFAGGKDAAAGRLVGAVMKLSGGTADAKAVREGLVAKLRG